jgi:AcrR family transcriptional regulator
MPASARSYARSLRPRAEPAPPARAARRKERTRERLLDAALTVFLARGYDGATTTDMTRVADLGAGTFYCHFRDKRAAFDGIAHRAARTMMTRWQAALTPGMRLGDGVTLGLEITAAFWREHPERARLLLEGGPSFGNSAHLRLVDDLATTLRARFTVARGRRLSTVRAQALAAFVSGLGIEIGRVVIGTRPRTARAVVGETIALARRAASALER